MFQLAQGGDLAGGFPLDRAGFQALALRGAMLEMPLMVIWPTSGWTEGFQ